MICYSANYGTGAGSAYPFNSIVSACRSINKPEQLITNDGFLVIWGGEDIHPSLYGEENLASFVDFTASERDLMELALIDKAVHLGMPVLGVCRGAQLCCAIAGGKLAQDIEGHGRSHNISTNDGRTFITSSVHHQMMYPFEVEHELLAWSTTQLSKHYVGLTPDEISKVEVEPEVVYFPEQQFLAVQGHPEFMDENCAFNHYIGELIKNYLFQKVTNENH